MNLDIEPTTIKVEEENNKGVYKIPPLIIILLFGLSIISVIYVFNNRTYPDILKYSLYTSIPIAVIFLIFIFVSWAKSKFSKPGWIDIILIIVFPIFVLLAGLLYYSVGASIKDLYLWILSPSISKEGAIILVVLSTFFLGLLLFYFRLRMRSLYGTTEALIGLVVAANRISAQSNIQIMKSDFFLAILTASVYLVVRGFDNIHQGLTKDPKDPYAMKLLAFFNRISTIKN